MDRSNMLGDLKHMREDMEHLMQHVFGQTLPLLRPLHGKWRPNVDVFECENSVVVVAELAGVSKEDVSVTFDEGKIRITGVRRDVMPYKTRKYCQMEISYNDFERIVHLPEDVDSEKISAKLNNGLLVIEAPKKALDDFKSQEIKIG
ncbi:MAG: Hsp20/alpha crystallin family protein [Candidatus Abyssobacteria bacterium SURF_5]|uniref:Hsp20/alpha crystallin family protein n=1 Tax=Abyssobacteria bacterium (strain SURF_5) TaxID=2093360 RepID=A0A3A4NZB5_ABYX5|nr:MAG: Hsp20/alpha crystallin family protein [Candidatus Abyssubacteria bacterium SURF_5]